MLDLVDYDRTFLDTPNAEILDILDLATPSKIKEYLTKIFSVYDSLGFAASCEEGCMTGNFYLGATCPKCKTVVREKFSTELWYKTWVQIPSFAPPILHPIAYRVLSESIGKVRMPGQPVKFLIDLLMDNLSNLPDEFDDLDIPQGMSSFYDNFDRIMELVFCTYIPLQKKQKADTVDKLRMFIRKFRHKLFVRHLPIMDPSLHLITKLGGVSLTDMSSPLIIEAIATLSGMVHTYNTRRDKSDFMDHQLYQFFSSWIKYPDSILEDKVAHKKGMCRKNILGSRTHCSFRGVIVPIVIEHESDELHVPWTVGVNILKLEIINVLINRRGMSLCSAIEKYFAAETSYDPDIDEIIRTLIYECPYKGLPALFGRNPSIRQGCEQLLFITRVDPDIHNASIGISPRIVTAPNA